MKSLIYFYSEISCEKILKEIFFDCDLEKITFEKIVDQSITNKNVLLIIKNTKIEKFKKNLFKNNNVVIFSLEKQNEMRQEDLNKTKFYYAPQHLKKFLDEIKNHFLSSIVKFRDIKIVNEKAYNIKLGKSCILTDLEKNILLQLIDKGKIDREYFLEKILGINKNTQTKTIESHFTRIRKKLLKIESKVNITSKEDVFSLEF